MKTGNQHPAAAARQIGRYEVVAQLDAQNLRARDTLLDRFVVLMRVPDGDARDEAVRRRLRGVVAAAVKLRHPNLVEVYDLETVGDESYVVTEDVDGVDLARLLEDGKVLPVLQVGDLLAQAVDALALLHECDDRHEPLQVQDIVVGHDGVLKIRRRLRGSDEAPKLGTADEPRATEDEGPAHDVYQLGAFAFQALTGRPWLEKKRAAEVDDGLFGAAYEDVVYRDATRDGDAGVESAGDKASEGLETLDAVVGGNPCLSTLIGRMLSDDGTTRPTAAQLSRELRGRARGERAEMRAEPRVDANVQYSVYRPTRIRPLELHPLVAFAHLESLPDDADEGEPEPQVAVEEQARAVLGDKFSAYNARTVDGDAVVPRDSEVTFRPVVDGLTFDPPQATFRWQGKVHREVFLFRASAGDEGRTLFGRFEVYVGAILTADLTLRITVDSHAGPPSPEGETQRVSSKPYRKIFASYSHRDQEIVQQYESYVQSLGDRYLRDVRDLRSGEYWNEQLLELIREADVFQLFWSRNSMQSKFVRQEYEFALKLTGKGPNFIRPTYWEDPFPKSADPELPPESLGKLHFTRLGLLPAPQSTPQSAESSSSKVVDSADSVLRAAMKRWPADAAAVRQIRTQAGMRFVATAMGAGDEVDNCRLPQRLYVTRLRGRSAGNQAAEWLIGRAWSDRLRRIGLESEPAEVREAVQLVERNGGGVVQIDVNRLPRDRWLCLWIGTERDPLIDEGDGELYVFQRASDESPADAASALELTRGGYFLEAWQSCIAANYSDGELLLQIYFIFAAMAALIVEEAGRLPATVRKDVAQRFRKLPAQEISRMQQHLYERLASAH